MLTNVAGHVPSMELEEGHICSSEDNLFWKSHRQPLWFSDFWTQTELHQGIFWVFSL